ncbi:hypothetical protein CDD83_3390 [Cordyceps sp. RAO-2017]|nr:hypothetical protein CDD83_3390 [Cordyceps sp. RAO-2017]
MASILKRPRPMAERTLRVLVSPTPLTFAERRSVLQVLELHGPIEFFKMAPGFHSNFVSVPETLSAAKKLVAASPLTYSVPVVRDDASMTTADLEEPISFDTHRPRLTQNGTASDPGSSQEEATKDFRLDIFPQTDYNHKDSVSKSRLCQPWTPVWETDRSLMATVLKQSLPQTMAAKGLAYWFFDVELHPRTDLKARRLQLQRALPSKMMKNNGQAEPQLNRPATEPSASCEGEPITPAAKPV